VTFGSLGSFLGVEAQPEGDWAPFDRSGWRSIVYPDPAR